MSFAANGVAFANGRHIGTNGISGATPQPGGDGCGAGILNLGGTVALTNCVLTNFVVQGGSASPVTATNQIPAPPGRGLGAAICNLGGQITLQSCQVGDNTAFGYPVITNQSAGQFVTNSGAALGGAIYSDAGECEIRDTTFVNNQARGGEAQVATDGTVSSSGDAFGGAIAVWSGSLQLSNSILTNNLAFASATPTNGAGSGGGFGGAVYVRSNAQAVVERTVLSGNAARTGGAVDAQSGGAWGGAVYSVGQIRLIESTLAENTARGGSGYVAADAYGGALASSGSLTVIASTFNDNAARGGDGDGGATNGAAGGDGAGGAIHSFGGSISMTNSTLALNEADGGSGASLGVTNAGPRGDARGGALSLVSNATLLAHVTLAYNRASLAASGDTNSGATLGGGIFNLGGAFSLRASIVATNSPVNFSGDVVDLGYNLSSDNSVAFTLSTSSTNTEPRIGPLSTNGGPTRTIALGRNSPALDRVPQGVLPSSDQRGVTRPQRTIGDIGAFEAEQAQEPPVFSLPPFGAIVRAGSNYTFQATADGPAPIGYFWLKNGGLISGATSASLTLFNVQDADSANYTVVATNSFGSTTSVVAVLTVNSVPLLIGEPADASVAPGSPASFAVNVNGPLLSYAWFKDGSPVPGATNATLTISNVVLGTQGSYQAVVTNFAGAVTSRVALLTFNSVALNIVAQPQSLTATQGTSVTLSALVSGVPPFAYQWIFGSVPIPDATNSSLTFPRVDSTNAGSYRVVVTNDYLVVTSSQATLTVVAPSPAAPLLTVTAAGAGLEVICEGTPGQIYELHRATRFGTGAVWVSVSTNAMPQSGRMTWRQVMPTNGTVYFRALAR
jgi:hypothetical protein